MGGILSFLGGAAMGSVDEEMIKASLTRINAGLQSAGSPKVFEQYQHGVYLNQPFGRSEHAHQVAYALGEAQGYARVEQDKGPDQNDQFWVRLLKPNEIPDDMLPIATGVIDQMRRLEHDVHQKPGPAEPQSEVTPTPTPTGEVVSTASLKVVELREKSAQLPGYAYADGHVAIHVDAADALGGMRDSTRYLTTRDDRDLSQAGGPLVVEFTKEELA